MPNVTKHDAEKERKSSAAVDRRVYFLVHRDSVGICDCLEDICELICTKMSRWLDFFEWNYFKVQFEISCVVLW